MKGYLLFLLCALCVCVAYGAAGDVSPPVEAEPEPEEDSPLLQPPPSPSASSSSSGSEEEEDTSLSTAGGQAGQDTDSSSATVPTVDEAERKRLEKIAEFQAEIAEVIPQAEEMLVKAQAALKNSTHIKSEAEELRKSVESLTGSLSEEEQANFMSTTETAVNLAQEAFYFSSEAQKTAAEFAEDNKEWYERSNDTRPASPSISWYDDNEEEYLVNITKYQDRVVQVTDQGRKYKEVYFSSYAALFAYFSAFGLEKTKKDVKKAEEAIAAAVNALEIAKKAKQDAEEGREVTGVTLPNQGPSITEPEVTNPKEEGNSTETNSDGTSSSGETREPGKGSSNTENNSQSTQKIQNNTDGSSNIISPVWIHLPLIALGALSYVVMY